MTPSLIHDLCERFERNYDSYRSASYNEALLRQDFLNPLFGALGWDMENRAGHAEAYRDVVHEDSIKVGGATKAPDYAFRIGGTRKFFVEAKKPQVNVKDDQSPAYQLRRYAWSAKLPLSILTNFEEFAVYDCRWRPAQDDPAKKRRIEYFKYTEFMDKWEFLAETFSREAILKGSFDKYAIDKGGKHRGTEPVDTEFLGEIEQWRELLARNLLLRNKGLSAADLNFAVARTIDRLLFLRVCEDRGIEEYGELEKLLTGAGTYQGLLTKFRESDERYNSGLFHFKSEKGRSEQPDALTPTLAVDDKILRDIIKALYYPESPYEFRVFPADILGQVYEQFLGKVITLKGRAVDVEYKPEVKKAGGVYYTPTYIVDYIVKHTVGKLLEGKTPDEVSKLRVLDPACGSGSFLIGAYQYLLDWHLAYYTGTPVVPHGSALGRSETPPTPPLKQGGVSPSRVKSAQPGRNPIYQSSSGAWRLTLAERKRILLNNIYGVDIDAQAVEVTKLSLLLKVLEGESVDTVQGELKLRHHALPDLGGNIKCGNSLIGTDILSLTPPTPPNRRFGGEQSRPSPQMSSFGGNKRGVNSGGSLTATEIARINPFDWETEFPAVFKAGGFDAVLGNPPYSAKQSLETRQLTAYYTTIEYKCDPYGFFIEQGLRLCRRCGYLGYIVPVTWMTNVYYQKLRLHLLDTNSLDAIVLFEGLVFNTANVDTCIMIARREGVISETYRWARVSTGVTPTDYVERAYQSARSIERCDITPSVDSGWDALRDRISRKSSKLSALGKISLGMKLRSNNEFVIKKKDRAHPDAIIFGDDIARYGQIIPTRYFNYSKAIIVGGTKNPAVHEAKPKVFIQAIRNLSLKRRIVATIDIAGLYFVGTVNALVLSDQTINIQYVTGLLNSNLLNEYFRRRFTTISLTAAFLGELPIRVIDFTDKADKARHDRMVKLVETMLELNRKLPDVSAPEERTKIERRIAATDREIDLLVYELYGLTAEEIKIVEGKS